MRYKCLVLDHDDTLVNSTATIHFPCFALIRFSRFGDAVDRNGFLEDAVTTVFFVPQDIHDHVLAEAEILSGDLNFLCLQRLRDHLHRLTGEEHLVDPLHDGCFFRHDLRLTIRTFSVAKEILVLKAYFSFFKLLAIRPCDMLADALGFGLRKARVNDKV